MLLAFLCLYLGVTFWSPGKLPIIFRARSLRFMTMFRHDFMNAGLMMIEAAIVYLDQGNSKI